MIRNKKIHFICLITALCFFFVAGNSFAGQKNPSLSIFKASYPIVSDVEDVINDYDGSLYGGAYVWNDTLTIGDNMDDFCGLPDGLLSGCGDFSLKIRFQLDALQESSNTLIHCLDLGATQTGTQFEILLRPGSDKIDYHFLDVHGDFPQIIETGVWYEIELNRFEGQFSLYWNDDLKVGPVPVNSTPLIVSSGMVYGYYVPGICIGQDVDTSSVPFDPDQSLAGKIDSIQITQFDSDLSIPGGDRYFSLDAGPDNAARNYLLLGSATGTSPGFPLPGGQATLPLNWDMLTDAIVAYLNTFLFENFLGELDSTGVSEALLRARPLGPEYVGLQVHFAYCLNDPYDFASNAVLISMIP